MKLRPTQLGVRKNTASSRQHALRFVVNAVPLGVLRKLRAPCRKKPSPSEVRIVQPCELPLTDRGNGTTRGETLEAEALAALREMFLLLDVWDLELRENVGRVQNLSEEYEMIVDLKTH